MECDMLRSQRQQSGQAAVLGMLCIFTMVIFVILSVNTGTLTNDRIRFQTTMDATAYAGAYEQARTLNRLTEINQQIVALVDELRERLNAQEWGQPPCSCLDYSPAADALIDSYQPRLDALAIKYQKVNQLGQTLTKLAARHTGDKNLLGDGAWNPFHLDFFDNQANSPTSWSDLVPSDRVQDTLFSYLYTKSCRCCGTCCPYPGYIREPLPLVTWFYKADPTEMVFFPAKLRGTPLREFMDAPGEGYFGATTVGGDDLITSYSAGKPYGGKIGTPDPGNDDWGPTMQPGIDGSTFEQTNFRPVYRARMMGLQEPMTASSGVADPPVTVADMIDQDLWAPEFRGKGDLFLH